MSFVASAEKQQLCIRQAFYANLQFYCTLVSPLMCCRVACGESSTSAQAEIKPPDGKLGNLKIGINNRVGGRGPGVWIGRLQRQASRLTDLVITTSCVATDKLFTNDLLRHPARLRLHNHPSNLLSQSRREKSNLAKTREKCISKSPVSKLQHYTPLFRHDPTQIQLCSPLPSPVGFFSQRCST